VGQRIVVAALGQASKLVEKRWHKRLATTKDHHGKTKRTRTFPKSQSASCLERKIKSKTEAAAYAGQKKSLDPSPHYRPVVREDVMHEHLPALAAKIAAILSDTPEYLVTQRAELRILRGMSEADIRNFAASHGWGVVKRLGGRQIEFYNDASVRAKL
jgi:hypothetical protein